MNFDKKDYIKELCVEKLTPVDILENDSFFRYAKRDDLYKPFSDSDVNGGKVRQAICLIGENYDNIVANHNKNVWTSTSTSSPQGIIIGKTASWFGLNSKIFIGAMAYPSTIKENPLMMLAYKNGSTINCDCTQAYEAPLYNQMVKESKKLGVGYYDVKFGINLDTSPDSLIMSTANQVKNIPDVLDNLIVPCGSCIILSGVIIGCQMFNKKVKNIIGVQIAGYDRRKTIDNTLHKYNINTFSFGNRNTIYKLLLSKDYTYTKLLKNYSINNGELLLDPLYEAKAYDYIKKHVTLEGKENLFWVVGNTTNVRNYKIEKEVVDKYLNETTGYVKIYGGKELR